MEREYAQPGFKLRPILQGIEQVKLACVPFVLEMNGVIAAKTRIAETALASVEVIIHAFMAKISEAVGFDKAPDLFQRTG